VTVRGDAVGYVLAGGQSRRMGRDKVLLVFRGQTLIERALDTLRQVTDEVAIVGDRPDLGRFAEIIPDAVCGIGPVAGLVAGLKHCTRDWAVFMPVDVPLLRGEILSQMIETAKAADALAVVPAADGSLQPLCLVLHRTLKDALERQMLRGERKVMCALEGAAGSRLVQIALRGIEQFANLNTPEDVAEYDGGEGMTHEF
jgi:molybdopterin-guanine dinucleotide biosynthesis protein A